MGSDPNLRTSVVPTQQRPTFAVRRLVFVVTLSLSVVDRWLANWLVGWRIGWLARWLVGGQSVGWWFDEVSSQCWLVCRGRDAYRDTVMPWRNCDVGLCENEHAARGPETRVTISYCGQRTVRKMDIPSRQGVYATAREVCMPTRQIKTFPWLYHFFGADFKTIIDNSLRDEQIAPDRRPKLLFAAQFGNDVVSIFAATRGSLRQNGITH